MFNIDDDDAIEFNVGNYVECIDDGQTYRGANPPFQKGDILKIVQIDDELLRFVGIRGSWKTSRFKLKHDV